MNGVATTRRVLLGATMIVAPVLLVVGHLITVPADQDTAPFIQHIVDAGGRYVPSTVMIAYGALLMPIAFIGLMRFAPARGGILVTIGAALATVAAVGLGAGNAMFGMVLGSLLPGHPALAAQVIDIAGDQPAAAWEWQLFPLFPAGLVLMGIGLALARRLPLWLPILLAIGGLLVVVSGAGGVMTFVLLLPLAAGLAVPGFLVMRAPTARTSQAGRPAAVAR